MHASECWIEEVKPHCATDQPMSSAQCATFLLNVAVFRRVPRSGLSSLQKQFRKTYYDCLRRICDVFMPLLCALFVWGNCRVYGDVSVSGWKRACFNDKVSFITIKKSSYSKVFICTDIAMRYPFGRFVSARFVVAQSTGSVFIPVVPFVRRRSVAQSAPLIGVPFCALCLWQRICPVSAS